MLFGLIIFFIGGVLVGLVTNSKLIYKHLPIVYLGAFFGNAVVYTFAQKAIDLELYLLPLAYTVAFMIVLKFRKKISK